MEMVPEKEARGLSGLAGTGCLAEPKDNKKGEADDRKESGGREGGE